VSAPLLAWAPGGLPPARADPATEARIHFRRGIELVKQRRLQAALEQFFLANRLAPNPNIVFNIALCLDKLGRPEEAFVYYRELARRPDLEAADRRRVRAALRRLEPRIARHEALGRFGRSPRVVAVKPGRHRVLVEKEGYRPAKAVATAVKGSKQTVRLRLEQILAAVRVVTPVPGARVRVDDQTAEPMGRTPVTLKLPPGPHIIFVDKPGHRPGQRRVVLRGDERRRLSVPLERLPPPTGTLQVSANVVGALVVLDGRNVGITPFLRRDVRAGTHRIVVHAKGYRLFRARFRLPARGRARVAVQLERLPRRTRRGPWPWITLGVTSASLIVAATLSGLAHRAHRDYSRASEPTLQALQQGRDLNVSADALWGTTAAAGLATALTFVLTWPDRTSPSTGNVRIESPRPQTRPRPRPQTRPRPRPRKQPEPRPRTRLRTRTRPGPRILTRQRPRTRTRPQPRTRTRPQRR
jgi:hypothetical protein